MPTWISRRSRGRQRAAAKSLEEVEVDHIRQVLAMNSWNIQRSAQVLGIDRATLYKKIRKNDLKKED